ncbi:MAG: YibE/F family protein [Clostridiales bacterium]|jgi:uncharacterized membrane protein|nr:YibE/F family protein [Clostridiales bacterium]
MLSNFSKQQSIRRNIAPIAVVSVLCVILLLLPVKYGQKLYENQERVKVEILSTDDGRIVRSGIIQFGEQQCEILVKEGKFRGETSKAMNHLNGSLENDKIFKQGDSALAVIDYSEDGKITFVNLVDHYRLNYEVILTLLFVAALVGFAGVVGFKALLSFVFTILTIWKVLLPAFLAGYNPIILGAVITAVFTAVIDGLVYGFDKRSLAAIGGSVAGSLVTCVTAIVFVRLFKIHGAIMPYSEQLLYSGFAELNLTEIFIAGIFIASSGAVMDLSVDITSAVHEIVQKRPDISKLEAIKSGLSIGRSVMGTMTTTLLLAYSGGYIALLMVFMAQGTPIINILNLKYVSAEILHTIVGSFGLVTVAPLTALISGTLLTESGKVTSREAAVVIAK